MKPNPLSRIWPAIWLGLACWGCGPSDREKERLKAQILGEIGVADDAPSNSNPSAPSQPAMDQVEDPWLEENALPQDDWEIQYLGNEPVGFFHRSIDRAASSEPGTLRLAARSQTRLRGREKEVEQKFDFVAFERENGDLIRFEGSVEVGPKTRRFEGSVRDGNLTFQTNLFGRGDSIRIAWNELDRGPFAIEQSLMRSPMQEGEQRQLRYFDPLFGRPIDAQLTAYDYFDTPTFDGGKEELLEIRITSNAQDDVSSSQIWVDRAGRIHKRYTPSLDLKSFRCSRESAMMVADRSELADLTLRPIKILSAPTSFSAMRPVRYRVESIDPDFSLSIPSRTQQVVRSVKIRKLDVTVYPAAQLTNPIEGIEQEPAPMPESLVSSLVINASHPEILRLADPLLMADNASPSDPAARRALAFARGVASRIETIPFDRRVSSGHTTLSAGQGDCFDIAALLAAMCRGNGIPARIAIGLRCDPKLQPLAMNLHAWTEIHDGTRWIPFDASTPDPEVAADRIKWLDSTWNTINPYESILQLATHLSKLEVSVMRSAP